MKKYRGYYIDHVVFNSQSDIDKFIIEDRKKAIRKYSKMMNNDRYTPGELITLTGWITDIERLLHNEDRLSWSEIEQIEIEAAKV